MAETAVIKYQAWNGIDKIGDLEDSIEDCLQSYDGVTEIERLIWNSEDDYHNYEPANFISRVY